MYTRREEVYALREDQGAVNDTPPLDLVCFSRADLLLRSCFSLLVPLQHRVPWRDVSICRASLNIGANSGLRRPGDPWIRVTRNSKLEDPSS